MGGPGVRWSIGWLQARSLAGKGRVLQPFGEDPSILS
jgi:hypothetical protein